MLVDLLRQAVEYRTGGDYVGIVLSGGLDSSTVAALAPPLPTFTGYYDAVGFDEREYARMVGKGKHHEILIRPEDFVANFDDMVKHLRPPIMGMGTFGQYMVAKYASQFVDVVLSGEGSDELFGGYARTLLAAGEPLPVGYEEYVPPADYPLDDLEAALAYDYDRLSDLLAVDEQMLGAFGVEGRAPFTDERVVRYALELPVTERVGKRHLREAVRGIVPDAIIDRKEKMGFPIPLVAWAQIEPVRGFILERLGYLPDPTRPFERGWWVEMVERARVPA
jgi:asparagine synthase (glutamine-hydrolysing)